MALSDWTVIQKYEEKALTSVINLRFNHNGTGESFYREIAPTTDQVEIDDQAARILELYELGKAVKASIVDGPITPRKKPEPEPVTLEEGIKP